MIIITDCSISFLIEVYYFDQFEFVWKYTRHDWLMIKVNNAKITKSMDLINFKDKLSKSQLAFLKEIYCSQNNDSINSLELNT